MNKNQKIAIVVGAILLALMIFICTKMTAVVPEGSGTFFGKDIINKVQSGVSSHQYWIIIGSVVVFVVALLLYIIKKIDKK